MQTDTGNPLYYYSYSYYSYYYYFKFGDGISTTQILSCLLVLVQLNVC